MTFFNRKNKETTPKLTRDEKLQIECDELNKRDEQYIDSLCYINELFIFRGYSVTYHSYRSRNEICVNREDASHIFDLKVGFTPKEYEYFLGSLDFNYDSGYGAQQLFGTVWISDTEWLERGEYDGSEWWDYKTCPCIPEYLKLIKHDNNFHY